MYVRDTRANEWNVDGEGNVLVEGETDGPGEVTAHLNDPAATNQTQTGELEDWGTYTFDLYVQEVDEGGGEFEFLDFWWFKWPYKLKIPAAMPGVTNPDGSAVNGHYLEFIEEADGTQKARVGYYLVDQGDKDANAMAVDLVPPSLGEPYQCGALPTQINTAHRDIEVHTFGTEDEDGEYIAVFMAEDQHGTDYRDHASKQMLAVNGRKGNWHPRAAVVGIKFVNEDGTYCRLFSRNAPGHNVSEAVMTQPPQWHFKLGSPGPPPDWGIDHVKTAERSAFPISRPNGPSRMVIKADLDSHWSLTQGPATVKVRLTAKNGVLNPCGGYAGSQVPLTFDADPNTPGVQDWTGEFQVHSWDDLDYDQLAWTSSKLPDTIGKWSLCLVWEVWCRLPDQTQWSTAPRYECRHVIYTTAHLPLPMDDAAAGAAAEEWPWYTTLDVACDKGDECGANPSDDSVMDELTHYVNGTPAYSTYTGVSAYCPTTSHRFRLELYLVDSSDGRSSAPEGQCSDSAAWLTILARALGIDRRDVVMDDPAPGSDKFYAMPIVVIGETGWRARGSVHWNYHEAVQHGQGAPVYDPTLDIDGDDDPINEPRWQTSVQGLDWDFYKNHLWDSAYPGTPNSFVRHGAYVPGIDKTAPAP